jgi:hypothetical protein
MVGGGADQSDDLGVSIHVGRDAGERHLDRLRHGRPFERRGHPPGIAHIALAHDLKAKPHIALIAVEPPLSGHDCAISGRSAVALGLNAGMRPCVDLIVAMPLQKAGHRNEPPCRFHKRWRRCLLRSMPQRRRRFKLAVTGGGAGCDVVIEADDTVRVSSSRDIDVDLDRPRHAVELAQRSTARFRTVGGAGVGDRLLTQIDDDGVEHRVHRSVESIRLMEAGIRPSEFASRL